MKQISFHGASGEVTGSAYVVTGEDDSKLLIDFGMFQGSRDVVALNYQPLQFDPAQLSGVFLTHAHLDHCGRLPMLVYKGFEGKIYMTEPTFALMEVVLRDAAKIAETKTEYEPLYTTEEVEKLLQMVEIVKYKEDISVGSFSVQLRDAGHILGSASVVVTDTKDNKKAVFSGDLGNTPEDIIQPTDFIDEADYVIMETTYGDKVHPVEDPSAIILEEINAVESGGGVLLLPAFSLERTQELLHRIYHMKDSGQMQADTPVFMDSPMGIRATTIFKQFREFYNEELQSHNDDPFSFEGLAVTEDPRDSKDILKAMEPKIIIAGSGMLSGGRILHHALNYLPYSTTHLLFVGYQAEETLGRRILEGAKNVKIYDKNIKVKAQVRALKTMSSHADQHKLLDWLGHIKGIKKVFLIHGEQDQRLTFEKVAKEKLHITDITLPAMNSVYELNN